MTFVRMQILKNSESKHVPGNESFFQIELVLIEDFQEVPDGLFNPELPGNIR